ncbi:CsbD family protein [Poseidonocella pacifica]|uniref:CsbD family protein n=1 Tax=Poseidonocella pacifica TaxID=871651 RepID=UPI001FE0B5D0|nr:CsbD family protein [Poseidonocella pacifica]
MNKLLDAAIHASGWRVDRRLLLFFMTGPTCVSAGKFEKRLAGPYPPNMWQGRSLRKDYTMDKDRVLGAAKVAKGKVKVAIGKAIGDAKLEAEGQADKVEGKVQNAAGGIKDTLRDA